MNKRVFLIECIRGTSHKLSQEAYWNYNAAKRFIETRIDKPEMITPYQFKSNEIEYLIHDVLVTG